MISKEKIIPSLLSVLLSAALIGGSTVLFVYFNTHICGTYRTARFWIFIAAIVALVVLGLVAWFWVYETESSDKSLSRFFAVGVVLGPALCIAGDLCVFFISEWFWIMTAVGAAFCAVFVLIDNHRELAAFVNAVGLAVAVSLVPFWLILPIYDDWSIGVYARAARVYNHVNGVYYAAAEDDADGLFVTGYHERDTEILHIPSEVNGKAVVGIFSCKFRRGCELKSVEIPYTVRTVGNDAFELCTELSSVAYTGSATQWCAIEFANENANPLRYTDSFYTSDGLLTAAVLDDGLEKISAYAFCGYGGLSGVVIPKTVTEICAYAFDDCGSLAEIEFRGTLSEWENVTKGENWARGVCAEWIKCSDGSVRV